MIELDGESFEIKGEGSGMLEGFVDAMESTFDMSLQILEYGEHALSQSANADAVTYLQVKYEGMRFTGIAIDEDIVTLKSADYVFLMDPWWNPAVEEQAIDRAHRLGREKPTFIYRLVAQGTIEERVRNLQLEKKETFRKIIGNIDKPAGLADHFSSLKELIELKDG